MANKELTATALDNNLRKKYVEEVIAMFTAQNEEVLQVGGNIIAFPTLNEEGGDSWVEITVKVPKGEKVEGGYLGYDGYERANAFKATQTEKAEKDRKHAEKVTAELAKKKAKTAKEEKGE